MVTKCDQLVTPPMRGHVGSRNDSQHIDHRADREDGNRQENNRERAI